MLARASTCVAWLVLAGSAPLAAAAAAEDALTALGTAYARAVQPGEQAEWYRNLFGAVLRRVQRAYAQPVDEQALIAAALETIEPLRPESGDPAAVFKTAINAALASLDPHSRYLDAREQREQRSAISGSFGGLGMEVDMEDGLVRVVAPIEDTPAARAGLRSGDLIVRFDDQPVLGMTLADAVARMRGEPGTPIVLAVRRPGRKDEFTVSLVRETIRVQALRWSMEQDVLVLRLARFTGSVGARLENAIRASSAQGTPRAVVLDMRGNPGGLLNEALIAADLFLSQGVVVSLRGRTARSQRTWEADPVEQLAGVPMVVLLDAGSASAAELVAAALQDNGRAVVMGQRSYGKGSVQSVLSLGADKGALRLTTALYHGPSGRSVQRAGVGPDIELIPAPGAVAPRPPRSRSRPSAARSRGAAAPQGAGRAGALPAPARRRRSGTRLRARVPESGRDRHLSRLARCPGLGGAQLRQERVFFLAGQRRRLRTALRGAFDCCASAIAAPL
jgi:carboxyl-terminal processing protease